MPFNSIIFVGFLAGVTALYYLVPRLAKPYFLLVASYAFYLYQPENADPRCRRQLPCHTP